MKIDTTQIVEVKAFMLKGSSELFWGDKKVLISKYRHYRPSVSFRVWLINNGRFVGHKKYTNSLVFMKISKEEKRIALDHLNRQHLRALRKERICHSEVLQIEQEIKELEKLEIKQN